jgi:hypothetical protein
MGTKIMSISIASLGIRINRKKLLAQVVELAESRIYWQHRTDETLPAYDAKATRTKLYQTLAEVENSELLELSQQLIALNEIGRRSNQTFERIQNLKSEQLISA